MKLIQQAMEDHYDGLTENEGTHSDSEFQREVENLYDEGVSLDTGMRIERVLKAKVDRGEDLTDEEIYVAVETIGNLYSSLGTTPFKGFGFENYIDRTLTQAEKSKLALEAITNQNAEKFKTWKAKFERFTHGLRDGFSTIKGSLSSMKSNAEDLLAKVRSADDSAFTVKQVTDKRVSLALNRGYKRMQFSNHKETLKALGELTDSVKILASASKYESLAGHDGSKYDLAQLAADMDGKIINKTKGRVTYDLNPEYLNGVLLNITIPDNSEDNYAMRNLKANFVISTSDDGQGSSNDIAFSDTAVRALNRKECEALLTDLLKYIDNEGRIYRGYYDSSTTGILDILKIFGKGVVVAPIGNLIIINSLIFRGRIDSIAIRIHLINRGVLRGLLAWVASSMRD